jgi:hypothetical protein
MQFFFFFFTLATRFTSSWHHLFYFFGDKEGGKLENEHREGNNTREREMFNYSSVGYRNEH